jgi:hypothetical protein
VWTGLKWLIIETYIPLGSIKMGSSWLALKKNFDSWNVFAHIALPNIRNIKLYQDSVQLFWRQKSNVHLDCSNLKKSHSCTSLYVSSCSLRFLDKRNASEVEHFLE